DAEALHGALAGGIRARWATVRPGLELQAKQAQQAMGRPPDFAQPADVLRMMDGQVETLIGLVESSERFELTATPAEGRLELALEAMPQPGGLAAQRATALAAGPLTPLLGLPAGVGLAALVRFPESEFDGLPESAPGASVFAAAGVPELQATK